MRYDWKWKEGLLAADKFKKDQLRQRPLRWLFVYRPFGWSKVVKLLIDQLLILITLLSL